MSEPTTKRSAGLGQLWQIASAISPRRNIQVMICIIFAGIGEGFGVATLLPLIAVLGDENSKSNALSKTLLDLLDRLHAPHDPVVLLVVIAVGMTLKAGLTLVALRLVGRAVADVSAKLRLDLVEALLDARWGFYVRQPVGRFSNALGGESTRAGDAYNALMQLCMQASQALIYLMLAALASWKVLLLAIAISVVMVTSLNQLLVATKRNARKQTRRMQKMLSRLTDVLIGIKPMKAMSRHGRFSALFDEDMGQIKKFARRQVFAKNANKALQEPILAICLGIGIYGALRIFGLPVGEVVVMSLLLAKTVSIVGKAQQELQNIYVAESGFSNVIRAIDESRAAREVSSGRLEPVFRDRIEFDDLGFAFGDHTIISGGHATIRAGELVALVGPSGTGKTTLVDLMLGLHTPSHGRVLVDGVPLDQLDLARWRSATGYVPQELMLFNDSIATNVTLDDPSYSRADVERALRQAGAWEFVARLADGTDTVVGERGTLLSGGQRQRIAVARALVHSPKLLILDEATSALDPQSERVIVDNVFRLARDTGLTVLAISHHAAWAEVADRVLCLENGRVTEQLRAGVAADEAVAGQTEPVRNAQP